MNAANRCVRFLIAIALCAFGAAVFTPRVAAQDDVWQVTRADYGQKSQRTDVTDLGPPQVAALCCRAAAATRLDVCWVDVRLPHIAEPLFAGQAGPAGAVI